MGRLYAFRKQGSDRPPASARGRKSGAFARVTDSRAASTPERTEGCRTNAYIPRWESGGKGTDHMINLSPSLRGCYADPIEWALREHGERLPSSIDDPGVFTTLHHYVNPKDPGAWPKNVAVSTVCSKRTLRSFVHRPDETIAVFGIRP